MLADFLSLLCKEDFCPVDDMLSVRQTMDEMLESSSRTSQLISVGRFW